SGSVARFALACLFSARLRTGAKAAHRGVSQIGADPEPEKARGFPARVARSLWPHSRRRRVDAQTGGIAAFGDALANCVAAPRRRRFGLRLPERVVSEETGKSQRRPSKSRG